VLDFEQEIVHHVPGKVEPAIAEKSDDDEVAVPSVHFVEPSAGDDVAVLQVEQAGRINRLSRARSQMTGGRGQISNLNLAASLELLHGFRHGKVSGKIKLWRGGQFCIAEGGTVRKRTGESVPSGGDIGANRLEPGARIFVRLLSRNGGRNQREKQGQKKRPQSFGRGPKQGRGRRSNASGVHVLSEHKRSQVV